MSLLSIYLKNVCIKDCVPFLDNNNIRKALDYRNIGCGVKKSLIL